jgi:LPS export ABC transporter protein LptC
MSSCVNDFDTIKKVTFDPDSPDDVTEDLNLTETDNGYATYQLIAKLAETYSKPQAITKFREGIRVNFFSDNGIIISSLTAQYGEINISKGTFYVKDSVQLINYAKNQRMETEELTLSQKDSTVFTNKEVIVHNSQGVLYGEGIRTKEDFSTYVFLKPHGKIDFDKK